MIVLFGGAAGVGKSTVARLWSQSRAKAVHIQLDEIRNLIVSGKADPQESTGEQAVQYEVSVAACTSLARSFANYGYDVAIDDVFEPRPTNELWIPQVHGFDVRLVIIHPPLDVALLRSAVREKRVSEHHIRAQHASVDNWPLSRRIDNSELTPAQTLRAVELILESAVITT